MRASMFVAVAMAMAAHVGTVSAGPPDETCLQPRLATAVVPDTEEVAAARRVLMRVSRLAAGADIAEVERLMGRPTGASLFQLSTVKGVAGKGCALVYADEPVRTEVTLIDGRVISIALDLLHFNSSSLPARARMVKPMMDRLGVLALLGRPVDDDTWIEDGRAFEQMIFARPGVSDFTVLLSDGVVIDLRPGRTEPGHVPPLVLPAAIGDDDGGGAGLRIGLNPNQAAALVGSLAWRKISASLAGQPVVHETHQERNGNRFVSMTFTGDSLTAFALWYPDSPRIPSDGCCFADDP